MTSPPPTYGVPADPPVASGPSSAPARRRGALRALLVDAALILGTFAVLGALGGLLWSLLAEPPTLTRFPDVDGRPVIGQDEVQLTQVFGVDGWYVVVSAVASFAAGAAFGRWRERDPLATLLLVVTGCLAAAGLMELVGHLLGPEDPQAVLEAGKVGTTAEAPLTVASIVAYLAWPLPALVGLLAALLRRSD